QQYKDSLRHRSGSAATLQPDS
ncbi:DUF2570 domain-containing protein, partial [Klebsiella pneumoniae]